MKPNCLSAAVIAAALAHGSIAGYAQGCIASRGTEITPGHSMQLGDDEAPPPTSGFQATVGYRWLHSDSMFVHDVEQKQIEAEGSQEINDSHFIDVGVTYAITPRFSATFTLPFSIQDRSQVVRALNAQRTILDRFHTQSAGIGDIRLEFNGWVLDPEKHTKGNILLGLGVSAPTGDRDAQDVFEFASFRGSGLVAQRHAVDQSIQGGNGGWGVILDIYAYQQIVPRLNAYFNGAYTLTPEQKYTPTASLEGDYSIADSYLARGGFEYLLWPKHSLSLSLGGRIDGVPIHDLIGGSDGFRRPGYAVSIEPGLSFAIKSWSFSVNTPVAVYRNRQQSVQEAAAGMEPVAASFADFIVTCSITKKF